MKNKIVYIIFFIPFLLFGCNKNMLYEPSKFKLGQGNDDRYLKVFDNTGEEVIILQFEEDGSVAEVHMGNYKGLTISVGRYDGALNHFIIGDTNIMYQNITHLNLAKDLLIDTQEQLQTISKKYQLDDKGQVKIEHWDYINEIWISEKEFEKQQTTRE